MNGQCGSSGISTIFRPLLFGLLLLAIPQFRVEAVSVSAGIHQKAVAQVLTAIPAPVGYVNDFAHLLDARSVRGIDSVLRVVRRRSKGELVVVTLPDVGADDVHAVGMQIGNQWGIGNKVLNTGVLVLLIPKQTSSDGKGHIRIEVGKGASAIVSDSVASLIAREAAPLFIRRDYGGGLKLIVRRISERFAAYYGY